MTTPRISRAYGLYALALLTLINVVNYMERNVIFALFQPIKDELALSDAHLGILGSAYILIFSLAALPAGILSDLRSRTGMTAFGVALWSVFTSLGGLVRNFGQLLACRAAVGLGGAAANAASTALVADYFTGGMRAVAMSIFTAGLALGGVLGILAAGQLEALYGWRVAFMALGLPGFALALLAARLRDPARWAALPTLLQQLRSLGLGLTALLRSVIPLLIGLGLGAAAAYLVERRAGPETGLDAAVFATLAAAGLAWNIVWWVRAIRRREALRIEQLTLPGMQSGLEELAAAIRVVVHTPTHGWVFVGSAMISFGVNGIIGWAPTFMTRELNLSVAEASLLLGKWGLLFGIGGTLAGGWLADTLQRRVPWARVAVSAAGFLMGGPLTIWLLTIRDLDLFVPVFCAAFFFLTWYNGPLTSVVFDVTPQRISTTVAGAYLLFIHLAGDAIALPIVGLLSDQFGIGQAVLILPVMTMLGAVTCLGALRTVGRDMARLVP